jgi:hypothetical protein
MIAINGIIDRTSPIIHNVVPVTPPTSLPTVSNPRNPERNFNTEIIVNTNAIISKIITPINDPINDDDKEDGLSKLVTIAVIEINRSINAILTNIVAIIANNDPDRKSCNALTSGFSIFHQINLFYSR